MAHTKEALYSNKIFLTGALPLVKVIANDVPSLKRQFTNTRAVIQVSCLDPDAPGGKVGTHFIVNRGEWDVQICLTNNPDIELEFKSVEALNDFFKGNISLGGIPKIRGVKKTTAATLASFVMVLLKMSSLLSATEPPEKWDDKVLMVKCYFYLLSVGISQLNKMGHDGIHEWALKSPDRIYAFAVNGYPELSAYIRVKEGNTRAGKGEYKKAMPFFTLRFDSIDSACDILMQRADMLEYTKKSKLIMDGGPEFGAQLGGFMLEIAALAK